MEWWIHNGRIIKNGVSPVTTLFFWKFCFCLRTSCKELIWCTNYPNVHIGTFCKHWSFIWRCFLPVGIILKLVLAFNNTVFFLLFVFFCIVIFVIIQLYFLFLHFSVLHFSLFESLIVAIVYMLNFFCYSFAGFAYVYY